MKSQFWFEQYHTTIDKRNTGYTEVVDTVPASETMLYYFMFVISFHQHTFQMSGNTQILELMTRRLNARYPSFGS